MSGRLTIVGFGPGSKGDMTLRAVEAIETADIVTGYTTYIKILKEFFPDKNYKATGMMKEIDRCRMAIEDAMAGNKVAMVSSGDSGIYGMTGLIYELAFDMKADIEIDAVPGVTAASSAAAVCAGAGCFSGSFSLFATRETPPPSSSVPMNRPIPFAPCAAACMPAFRAASSFFRMFGANRMMPPTGKRLKAR